jgi:tellurite resistance protein
VERLAPTVEEAVAALRMMKAIALADGGLDEREVSLIGASARALGVSCDARTLAPATAEEVGAALGDPRLRERAVQAAVLVAMIDGTAAHAEVEAIEHFAAALGVDEPRVRNLRQLADGHVRRLWLDLARRSFARPIFERALKERGLEGVLRIALPMVGLGKDPDLARRYNDLGKLPEGTLGRAYWRFVVDNDLGFPGEGVVAEDGVWHDLSHVLGGYDTSPAGEVSVVSFIAGYRREDPFFWLFTIALQFHLGVKVSPYSPPLHGHFDPALVLAALHRGMAMNRDLSVDWDYRSDLERSVDEVRSAYGVPPAP